MGRHGFAISLISEKPEVTLHLAGFFPFDWTILARSSKMNRAGKTEPADQGGTMEILGSEGVASKHGAGLLRKAGG
jgi:hypothetical protein